MRHKLLIFDAIILHTKNYFNLLIKVYYPNEKDPVGGLMSQYIDNLKINDIIQVSGPAGRLTYKG